MFWRKKNTSSEKPLKDTLPEFARELEHLLATSGRHHLAKQVPELKIVDRCRCRDDFCSTFYTQPKPQGT
jgi:hypothetical protein